MSDISFNKALRALAIKRNTICVVLTLVIIFIYFGFMLLIAFNKAFLAKFINEGSNITIAIPLGIAVIIIAFIITAIYVYWSNTSYDKSVNKLKNMLEKENKNARN